MWGETAAAEASMTWQQIGVHRVFSRGSCPWITGPWQLRAAQAPGRGGVDSDLFLHTGFLFAAAAALASYARLWGPALIAAACARLWSSFRWCSESPLLAHPETVVSCLLCSSRLFPGLPLASCGALAPFMLCSRSQPQSSPWGLTSEEARASAPTPCPPQAGEQTSLSGW